MTDRAMTEEAMLASLHDIALPAHAPGGWAAEIAVVIGLAALAALILGAALRAVSAASRAGASSSPERVLAALEALPDGERRPALLRFLKDRAPERYQTFAADLYRPDGGPDLPSLERAARDVARGGGASAHV